MRSESIHTLRAETAVLVHRVGAAEDLPVEGNDTVVLSQPRNWTDSGLEGHGEVETR